MNYLQILRNLSPPFVRKAERKQRKRRKRLDELKHDIKVDKFPVEITKLPDPLEVMALERMIRDNKFINHKDWFVLENKLLDKYFLTNKQLADTDLAKILRLDLKPFTKFLNDNAEEIIILNEKKIYSDVFMRNLKELERRITLRRQEYLELVRENPRLSRYDLLKRYQSTGIGPNGKKITRMESLTKSLANYKVSINKYEEWKSILGDKVDLFNDVYKTWNSIDDDVGRHGTMDDVSVKGMDTPFKVVYTSPKGNSKLDGAIDYLQFPGDLENDYNNGANIINCRCTYELSVDKSVVNEIL